VQISVTGRHVDITEPMKEYAQEKAAKLTRYYDRIERIEVIVDQESNRQNVEMVVRADHKNTFVAQVESKDFYEALDRVIDKIERQLIRHKERFRNRKHPGKPETE